ncbi:hypothetical protein [Undibacterium sp.]|uniref:hypothetical protein n=1 Tax=Undibacterium sp. TaxID=1914977 RepID=UPI0027307576|nr:hypothetical protein [Undibacterium sp.]MDP1978059.1 hypothetical protein [Undibacterium sp.]
MKFISFAKKIGTGAALTLVGVQSALAADPPTVDLTQLTSSFTSNQIVTAVLAVSVTLMSVYVAIKAVKIVIGMVRG